MRNIVFILILLLTIKANCQNSNYISLPSYDCDGSSYKKSVSSKEIIFVFPNDKDSSTYMDWIKPIREKANKRNINCIIKFENELIPDDFRKSLWIIGLINSFQNWDRFNTPIKRIANGFAFADLRFSKSNDAIFYFSDTTAKAMRFVITGNSISSLRPVVNYPKIGYNYSIYENGVINYFGNCSGNKFDKSKFANLTEVKSKNYQIIKTKYYDFYISNRFINQTSTFKSKLDSFDLFVDKYINVMKLKTPSYRIPCFIHFDQEEISYISTFFDHLCGGNTSGCVNGKEIHSKGFGGAIEHESSHLIFDSEYNEFAPTFFVEGIRQYYDYITNPTQLSDGFRTAIEFLNEDIKPVILGQEDFFQGNKYYQISGIFVKYLVDNWGLDKFKQFYKTDNIEIGFEQTYNSKLDTVLFNYKEWLKKK